VNARLHQLLVEEPPGGNDERAFTLQFAFCRHLPDEERLELLRRRRAELDDRLARVRDAEPGRDDRYARSLVEHRTDSIARDLQWVDELIAAEGRQLPRERQEGATA
jgi:hypothetical protein